MEEKKYVFGVDVGGMSVKIGLFTISGQLLEKWEIATDRSNNGDNILPDIAKTLEEKIQEKGFLKEEFLGIGLGVPGPVDSQSVVRRCVNLGWGTFSIEECLYHLIGMPVKAGNDANVAALGEMWRGTGEGKTSMVMITIGTGIGGAIISEEKVITGANGSGGEIGHLAICLDEEESCNCGKKGCVEQYASATGIVRQGRKLLLEGKLETSLVNHANLTAKEFIDAAKSGDALGLKVVDIMGWALGLALSHATCLCDPEIIIIGGGVSKGGDIIREKIDEYYRKYAFHATLNTPIAMAKLGNDAGIYGAARLLI